MKTHTLKQLITILLAPVFLGASGVQAIAETTMPRSASAFRVVGQNMHLLLSLGQQRYVMTHSNLQNNQLTSAFKLPHAAYAHTFVYEKDNLILLDSAKKQLHFLNPDTGDFKSRYTLSYNGNRPLRGMAIDKSYFWFINNMDLIKFDRQKNAIVSILKIKDVPIHGRNKAIWNYREGSLIIHQNSINKSAKAHCKHAGLYEVSKYSGQVIKTILKGCYSYASVSDGYLYYTGNGKTGPQTRIIQKLKL